jgi:protein O-mannosyl-transferase
VNADKNFSPIIINRSIKLQVSRKINKNNEEIKAAESVERSFFRTRKMLFAGVGLAVACLLIYFQTTGFNFINVDDKTYIYDNPIVLNGLSFNSVYWAFTAVHVGNWHPITWLSHIIDSQFFGLHSSGHHAVNIFFHTVNSILAMSVFYKLTGDFLKSSIVAFLFAVHPMHVESVAWIAERKDLLSTMFWLLTMLMYFKFATAINRRKLFYALMLLFFVLGLMSKAMLVTLPCVLLLCDYWKLERLKNLRDLTPLVTEKIPLFICIVISSLFTFFSQSTGSAVATLQSIPFESRLLNVIFSYAKYVVMMFYPINLSFFYPFNSNFNTLQIIGSIILISSVTIFCVMNRTKRKYLLFGWLWFLGTLVPVIGFVQVGAQSMADRYTYVPYFGLFVMIVWGTGELFERFGFDKKAFAAVWLIVVLIFGGLAYNQTTHWKNSETLYTYSLKNTEKNYFLMANLCLYYIFYTKPENAEPKCTDLMQQMPPDSDGLNWLGLLRIQTGKYDEAAKNFQTASQLKSDWGTPVANLSAAFAKQGNLAEAENTWQKSFAMKDSELNKPTLANTANIIGTEFLKRGQTDKAILFFTKATELQPNLTEAQENLRKAMEQQK